MSSSRSVFERRERPAPRTRFLCRFAFAAGGLLLATAWAPAARAQVTSAEQLKIRVLKGEGDAHRPGDKAGSVLEVQILNEVDLPQPEAEVSFKGEADGPGVRVGKDPAPLGVTVRSDARGVARVENVLGNKVKGPVTIHVEAAFEGKSGSISINQVNESGPLLNRKRGSILAGVLATTGIILYEILKPGPPTATINAPTATTTNPQVAVPRPQIRIGR